MGTATVHAEKSGVELKFSVEDCPPVSTPFTFTRPPSANHLISNRLEDTSKSQTGKEHGLENPAGHHAGDMLNFTVKPNGTAKATVKNDAVVLGNGSESNSLFANGGTALVIHAKPDDMQDQPSRQRRRPHRLRRDHENSGSAFACFLARSGGSPCKD